MTKANDRGEVAIPLDGQDYRLRPSFEAIVAIEQKLGRSLFELADAARSNGLAIPQLAMIAAEMMHAYGAAHPDDPLATDYRGAVPKKLERLIFEAGTMLVQPRIAVLLLAAVTGGVDASGEMRAVATTADATAD